MDALMLDAHQYGPPGMLPGDRQGQGQGGDERVHGRAHLAAIGTDFLHPRPVVMSLAQIVPAHLVHADGEHRLETRMDALTQQAG